MSWLGWPLGWAFTTAAVFATGGTSGWTQSPSWHAVIGIALGAAGMFAGAWWSRGRRQSVAYAAAYAAGFLLAAGILKLGFLGQGMLSYSLAGGIVALIGESARRPFSPRRIVRWGTAFAIGTFLMLFPGSYLSHFVGMFAEWITGLQTADTAGNVLGAALAGGLCGVVAAFIGDPDDPDD